MTSGKDMSAFQLYRISWFSQNLSRRALNVSPVWHSGLTVEHSNRIEAIQKRVFRLILAALIIWISAVGTVCPRCTKDDICWPDSFFIVY